MTAGIPFLRGEAWPLLLLVPVATAALLLLERRRRRATGRLVGPRCHVLAREVGPKRRALRVGLVALALFFGLIAVLEPAFGEPLPPPARRGKDLVIALDVSRSMAATDVAPNRLQHARRTVIELADAALGDRIALVAFAGEARLLVPATADLRTVKALVALDDPLGGLRGGTDLEAALDQALAAVPVRGDARGTIVLVTDGEDHEGRGLRAAARCRARGVVVHVIGIGTREGSKIPIATPAGPAFLKDASGTEVVSALDPGSLERLAEAGGGRFVDGSRSTAVLAELHHGGGLAGSATLLDAEGPPRRPNRFQWPLLLGVGVWMLELALSDRSRRR